MPSVLTHAYPSAHSCIPFSSSTPGHGGTRHSPAGTKATRASWWLKGDTAPCAVLAQERPGPATAQRPGTDATHISSTQLCTCSCAETLMQTNTCMQRHKEPQDIRGPFPGRFVHITSWEKGGISHPSIAGGRQNSWSGWVEWRYRAIQPTGPQNTNVSHQPSQCKATEARTGQVTQSTPAQVTIRSAAPALH